jgi:hypothetical protein
VWLAILFHQVLMNLIASLFIICRHDIFVSGAVVFLFSYIFCIFLLNCIRIRKYFFHSIYFVTNAICYARDLCLSGTFLISLHNLYISIFLSIDLGIDNDLAFMSYMFVTLFCSKKWG